MEYTVQKLAKLSGVTTRTLRYYDEIEILKPARINSSGYRIYGDKEVDRLQQILFYREFGVGLECIKKIVNDPSFNESEALREHREKLLEKRKQLDKLIENLDKTIEFKEGRSEMSNKEKFEGFKKKLVEENENKYGKEIRDKYGESIIDKANIKLMNLTEEQFKEATELEVKFKEVLKEAFKDGNPASSKAQEAAMLHKIWLEFYWNKYSSEAHAGLAQMYVDDERFRKYYDKDEPGMAEFLRDTILIYTGMKE
ncbi:MerR family transcriptional regulator [Clostridium sp. SHJSY1]|uniref:MerR family transcriptional regulator n=1 Tax=Clostridium sp. SHJSY1 TaxID=2942483 RepID=UPI0028751842|nr:MerR family transcriptional regulator [Clostridium sp. SHJSY1]MDS0526260.1 MerR family transcriptional regulator [Clostridium sp. SHJSY1]